MNLGIAGVGVIGGVLKRWLEVNSDHSLQMYDPQKGHNDSFNKLDALFISISVPTDPTRGQDLSSLKELIYRIPKGEYPVVLIRSTVLPGTCDALSKEFNRRIFAMPEFLTERTADQDFAYQPILVGSREEPEASLIGRIFYPKVIHYTTNTEAELAKYAHNCFGAMKVNYFNIIHEVCEKMNIDYERVRQAILGSGYIESFHTKVPGPDGKNGYGGKCFPKDLKAFIGLLDQYNVTGASTLRSVEWDNTTFRAEIL